MNRDPREVLREHVKRVQGDAEATGIGALGVLVIIWALTEAGRKKLGA